MFLKWKIESFGPNKTTLFFLNEDKFQKDDKHKHINLRNIESSGVAIFKEHLFFLDKELNVIEIKNRKFWAK